MCEAKDRGFTKETIGKSVETEKTLEYQILKVDHRMQNGYTFQGSSSWPVKHSDV